MPKAAGDWPTTQPMGLAATPREGACKPHRGQEHRPLGLRGVSFIGSEKRVLRRVLGEKGVVLTAEAAARLDALPERFMDFIAAPERFFARPEAA